MNQNFNTHIYLGNLLQIEFPSLFKPNLQRFVWIVSLLLLGQMANAQLTVTKTEKDGLTTVADNTPFTYVIAYSTPSTTENYTNLTICDQLPASVEFLAVSAATGDMTDLSYDATTRTVCATFISPWNGGTGQFEIVVKFLSSTYDGTLASNVATIASSETNFTTPPVNITVDNPDNPPPTVGNTPTITKTGNGSITDGGIVTYSLFYGIGGNDAVTQYVVTDVLPSGFILGEVTGGRFIGTSTNYNIYYKTNLNSTWQIFPDMPLNTCCWNRTLPPTLPSGEYITEIQLVYDNLPAGPQFTQSNFNGLNLIGTFDNSIAGLNAGDIITNCASCLATGPGAGSSAPSCAYATFTTDPYINLGFGKWERDWQNDFAPGDIINFCIEFGDSWQGDGDFVNPTITDLLPTELSYLGNVTITEFGGTPYTEAGSPVPGFEATPNFGGTGRTLLRWYWDSDPATAAEPYTFFRDGARRRSVRICFDTQLKDVPTGQFNNDAYIGTENTVIEYCSSIAKQNDNVVDTNDMDGDGNTTEEFCHSPWPINVINPSGAALSSVKWVKGSLDAAYSRYPDIGHTTPGGIADYQLVVENVGSVDVTNIVIIDILPYIGDAGVIDLSPRGTEWTPYLAGPVTAPAGVTVYYSTSPNPCRTELNYTVASCDAAPNWTTSPPADITTVKSLKFDFGSITLAPTEQLILEWPMRAPIDAPTNNEVAWNSFGYIGTRADNGSQLPPSEPLKVGIAIEPIQPAVYGDYVWFDSNHNGIQDEPASQGLNGITVQLYEDTNGNGIAEPGAGDNLVSFTVTNSNAGNPGYYLFPNLPPGDYFAVFYIPSTYTVTLADQGANDALDSDGTAGTISGQAVIITPITNLIATEDDRTWDLGVYCTNPTATVLATDPSCSGGTPNNDGKIEITATDGAKYGYSTGSTYTGPNFATASIATSLPITVLNNIPNADPSTQYTIRVYSSDGACYYDQTVTVNNVVCNAPLCNLSTADLTAVSCNDNSTASDPTDDYITFSLNPTGTTLGSGYVVTVSTGTITPNTGTYGTTTVFQLQNGSAGSGNTITVTVTDATDTNCKVQVDVTDPGSCSTSLPSPDLSLTKTVNTAIAPLNSQVTFTLTLTNDNSIDATGVVVTDQLPAGVTFVATSDPANVTVSGSIITWNVGTFLGTDAPKTLDITVTASSEGSFVNNTEITAMNETDDDSTPNNNLLGEDDQDQVCFSVPVSLCSDSPTATIAVTADLATSYQWYVSTDNGANYTALSGETNQTLTIDNTLMGGNGVTKYFKVAYNGAGINDGCNNVMCCPIIVTTQTCTVCPPTKCLPIGITKH